MMTTTKKVVIGAAVVGVIYLATKKKKVDPTQVAQAQLPVKNEGIKSLQPIKFQDTQLAKGLRGLGVDRGFCSMRNPDGSNTIYGESMISGNPCPRGGSLMPIKKSVKLTGV